MNKYLKLAICVMGCELVGITSSVFTVDAIPTWYATLNKPFFSPPNWIFGPVWTILYAVMGVAVFLIWQSNKKITPGIRHALTLFVIQLVLNFFWSLLFFGLQSPELALVEIGALWISIFLTIRAFYPISKTAAYLMLPYILWVSFAMVLNLFIAILN